MNNDRECEAIRVSAMALADGESLGMDSRQVAEHLDTCAPCHDAVSQDGRPLFPKTAGRARHAADFWPAILDQLATAQVKLPANRSGRAAPWRATWLIGLSTVACLLLVS